MGLELHGMEMWVLTTGRCQATRRSLMRLNQGVIVDTTPPVVWWAETIWSILHTMICISELQPYECIIIFVHYSRLQPYTFTAETCLRPQQ
jgi:hypothetical protein